MKFLLTSLLFLSMTLLGGCETAPVTPASDTAPSGSEVTAAAYSNAEEYRIGVDDLVSVNVWKNPDLSVQVPVRPDGNISVPLIGDVAAGGKTPTEVAANIKSTLSEYLREPQVTVILTELNSHEFLSRVRVTGAVEEPVSLPYRPGMTVLDAVLEAGGVNRFASGDGTRMFRKNGDVVAVKLDMILTKGDLSSNFALLPGDVITVPERLF